MKPTMILGIVLIVLGLAGLVFKSISYTSHEKVVDFGGLKIIAETRKTIPEPVIAGLIVAAGLAVVVVASRKP